MEEQHALFDRPIREGLVWPSVPRYYANYRNWTDHVCFGPVKPLANALFMRPRERISPLSRFVMFMIAVIFVVCAFSKKGLKFLAPKA